MMGKGGRGKHWTEEMDRVLLERFASERNEDLAREFGYGVRTIVRHAHLLGLEKNAEFMDRSKAWSAEGYRRWCEYMRITGQKVKKKNYGGRPFPKGHRFEGEVEARRVKAIQDRAQDERLRIIRGQLRATKWPMVDYGTGAKK